jgi:hypothetical protein
VPVDLPRLLGDAYPGELRSRSLDDVRAMRAECEEAETGLSYLRRLVQGRLDIVGLELRRRADGGEPGDLGDIIARLPETLAEHTRAPGLGRLPHLLAPGADDIDPTLAAELDGIVAEGELRDLGHVSDADLADLAARLEDLEARVSAQRRALFARIDGLQADITRRYKSGEASVESLLEHP